MEQVSYAFTDQGSMTESPQAAKSSTLLVAKAAPWTSAIAAI